MSAQDPQQFRDDSVEGAGKYHLRTKLKKITLNFGIVETTLTCWPETVDCACGSRPPMKTRTSRHQCKPNRHNRLPDSRAVLS